MTQNELLPIFPGRQVHSNRFFRVAHNWILPLLAGLLIGWLIAVFFEAVASRRIVLAFGAIDTPEYSKTRTTEDVLDAFVFLKANPFKVTQMKRESSLSDPVDPPPSPGRAVLRGTMPDIGVWMEENGKLYVILIGNDFASYTLETVDYLKAVFCKGEDHIVKYLSYMPDSELPVVQGKDALMENPRGFVAPDPARNMPGYMPRTELNRLLENPIGEMGKMHIRPLSDEQGLQLTFLRDDSIFKALGLQKGDVVRSVNGIPFYNMGDIANCMSSMIQSDYFQIVITRNGEPVSLAFVVN